MKSFFGTSLPVLIGHRALRRDWNDRLAGNNSLYLQQ